MYPPNTFHRRDSLTNHPPYGLFLDPHRGQHSWTAASSRVLLGIIGLIGSILIVITLGPH
jgi:hypothetical protein